MKEKLLVINLEDNRNDAELIREMLASGGIACEIRHVETQADFLSALAEEGIDLILADYALPGFDGLAALELARERCPDIPFIFVTGTMGEEIAVESLKHGATDYVVKQNLSRLAPAVRRALQEAEEHRERKQAEERLKTALAEKESLLRELYHRTRNNMQVIRSMLSLHAAYHPDLPVAAFVKEIDQKILAMAMVHQQLYESQDLSRVNLRDYLGELVYLLMQSYNISSNKIAIRTEEMDNVSVVIDTAIPFGLIVNELMSNALKYAFPDERTGEIRIKLCQHDDGVIELSFADNGVGVPEGFDFRTRQTFGLQTIFAIVERQLRGTIAFTTQNGIACTIRFQDNLYAPRV